MENAAVQLISEVLSQIDEGKVKLGNPLVNAMRAIVEGTEKTLTAGEVVGQLELESFFKKSNIPSETVDKIDAFLENHPEISVKYAV